MRKDTINFLNKLNESQKLEEKRNPENDEANDLIKKSLSSDEYAKTHATELRKHGIKYIPPEKDWQTGALEGKQGRRLAVSNSDFKKDDVRKVTDRYNDTYAKGYENTDTWKDETDLHQKTYAKSKEAIKNAKRNMTRQTNRVEKLNKAEKENKWAYEDKAIDARRKLRDYKETLEKGVKADYSDSDKIHPDADLKGFLNAKKHSDRPLPREKDPEYQRNGGRVADPANKDVEDYKSLKSNKDYLNKEKERNKEYDAQDKERIEDMKKRAKEDKKRRDFHVKSAEKRINKVDKRINDKLDAFRKRMNKQ